MYSVSFSQLLALVGSGVTLHNGLRLLAAKLSAVATAVETGDVKTLAHDAKGAIDFVETHDPALAKSVEAEASKLKDEALAEVAKARHAAAETLRALAADVEKAASASAPASPAGSPTPPATS
ncbi:hypothetical protein [Kitasatospora aureofaciens]|uniref:hypothetical protein n=1 Tax=Kitasatospora aureofaciens TaxID=1894 RepID=UPI0033EAFC06